MLVYAARVRMRLAPASTLFFLAVLSSRTSTYAQDGRLRLHREPTRYTDVVDAFDDADPFDLHLTLGVRHSTNFGRIQRQVLGMDNGAENYVDVASFAHDNSAFVAGLNIGIFRDLALYAQLPLVFSDTRSLGRLDNTNPMQTLDAGGQPLFDVPFRSPTRAGLESIDVGLAWSILNQARSPHDPTWLIMLGGSFNLGDPLNACSATQNLRCQNAGQSIGLSRGTNLLKVETRASYRYAVVEPFFGARFQAEFAGFAERAFRPGGNLEGFLRSNPPLAFGFTLGASFFALDDLEEQRRIVIDLGIDMDYFMLGRDYSPLFDALGSSTNPYLQNTQLNGVPDASGNTGLVAVQFTGLTEVEAHARYGGRIGVEFQVADMLRFNLLSKIYYLPSYGITQTEACNSGYPTPPDGDTRLVGSCVAGIINPNHRLVIDGVGHRFRVSTSAQIELTATATLQF